MLIELGTELGKDKGVQEVTFKIAFDADFLTKVRFLRDMGFASHTPINVNSMMVEPILVANRVAMSQKPPVVKVTLVADCITQGMPADLFYKELKKRKMTVAFSKRKGWGMPV